MRTLTNKLYKLSYISEALVHLVFVFSIHYFIHLPEATAGCEDAPRAMPPVLASGGWEEIPEKWAPSKVAEANAGHVLKISKLVEKYHQIQDRDVVKKLSLLNQLIRLLSKLGGESDTFEENTSLLSSIRELKEKVEVRIRYLSGILEIPKKLSLYYEFRDKRAHAPPQMLTQDVPEAPQVHSCSTAKFKNSNANYCSVIEPYQADIVTQLDPALRESSCIRELMEMFSASKDYQAGQSDLENASEFYHWLEEFNLPQSQREMRVRFRKEPKIASQLGSCYSRTEHTTTAEGKKVQFDKDGFAYQVQFQNDKSDRTICDSKNHKLSTLKDGRYIYLLDQTGDLFLGATRDIGSMRLIGHLLLAREFVVRAAGEMEFKNGKISEINGKSGHYRPSDENLMDATEFLIEKWGKKILQSDAEIVGCGDKVIKKF